MARKRALIPSFPLESRILALILGVVGVALVVWGWWDDSNEMMALGGLCVVGGVVAVVADRVLGTFEDEE